MTRKQALNLIRAEVAKNGEITQTAQRYYIENRISHDSYMRAVNAGMEYYEAQQKQDEPVSLITLAENRKPVKPAKIPAKGERVSIFDL